MNWDQQAERKKFMANIRKHLDELGVENRTENALEDRPRDS